MNHDLLKGLPAEKLTPAQEQELVKQNTDEARESLVLHTMSEAFFYARRCARQKLPDDEIFSLCYTALTNAARNFEANWQRFFAYAKVYVRGQICREWKAKDVVRNAGDQTVFCDTLTGSASDGFNAPQRPNTDLDSIQYRAPIKAMCEHEPAGTHEVITRELWSKVQGMIQKKLSKQEQIVLAMAYKEDLNFQEIATLLGVTRSAIQSAHVSALKKLQREIRIARQKL